MQLTSEIQDSVRRDNDVRIVVNDDLILRELIETDAQSLYEAIDGSRNHLRRWLHWVDSVTNVETVRGFIASAREKARIGTGLPLHLECQGRIVGWVNLTFVNTPDRHARLAYWLTKEAQGKGLISTSCRALIEYGFENFGLNRVVLWVEAANTRSRNVAERLGFVEVSAENQSDISDDLDFDRSGYSDLILYSLHATDWVACSSSCNDGENATAEETGTYEAPCK